MEESTNADSLMKLITELLSTTKRAAIEISLFNQLEDALQTETTSVSHWTFLSDLDKKPLKVLDFGCGLGRSRNRINSMGHHWTGLDIPDSVESVARKPSNDVILYDGGKIPVNDAEFDVVLSLQTFEHIQDIDLTFSEISRILKPNGHLIGAVSQMEAFHSMSTFNFTPYGLKLVAERNGMELSKVHPQIDSISLIFRSMMRALGDKKSVEIINQMFHDSSPINKQMTLIGEKKGLSNKEINSWKLQYCGQFSFDILKK